MSLTEQKFGLADLCAASGANDQTAKAWLAKGHPVGSTITGGGGPGQRRAFTFNTVMEFSLVMKMQELLHGTRDVGALFNLAMNFAHASGGGDMFDLPYREVGLPFHHDHGDTIFAASPVRTFEDLANRPDLYSRLRQHTGSDHFVTINATRLFIEVCGKLGHHPLVALDEAYGQ